MLGGQCPIKAVFSVSWKITNVQESPHRLSAHSLSEVHSETTRGKRGRLILYKLRS